MEQATRDTWAKRIERWTDSGLSAKEFSTEVGISERSLTWWKWRLGAEANGYREPVRSREKTLTPRRRRRAKTPTLKKRHTTKTKTKTPAMTFVEMPKVARAPDEQLEVVLPSCIRIRVGAAFDSAALERLLDVLDRRR